MPVPLQVFDDQPTEPEIPRYEGNLQADAWALMRSGLAQDITGGLSWPSKMDCPSWGIPATRCRLGSVLATQPNTVCSACYALRGTFQVTKIAAKLERCYQALFDVRWTPAMYALIRWHATDRFRWFHSGDLQSLTHLQNILRICTELRDVLFLAPNARNSYGAKVPTLDPRQHVHPHLGQPRRWPCTQCMATDLYGRQRPDSCDLPQFRRRWQLRHA